MKNLLIKATLVVLLSVNVLTPISYATGDLFENVGGISENVGGISENNPENGGEGGEGEGPAKNPQSGEDGEGSDIVLLGGKEVAPTGSGTEDFYENDESGKNPLGYAVSPLSKGEQSGGNPQSSTSSNPAPLDKEAQSGENGEGEDDVISNPNNENGEKSTEQGGEGGDALKNPQSSTSSNPAPLDKGAQFGEGGEELSENPQSLEGEKDTPKDPQSGNGQEGQEKQDLTDPEDLPQAKAMPLAMPLSLEPLDMAPLDPVPLMAPAPSQANSTTVKDLHLYFVDGSTTKHYTIMDRNMGASDIKKGGYYYQWGNNYGFTHPLTDSGLTQVPYDTWYPYEAQPSTYSSSTFVKHTSNWQDGTKDQKFNSNLWGGKDDESFKNGIGTTGDRQGPCATGYYVPSAYDFNLILNAWTGSYPNYDDSNHNEFYDKFASDLLLTLDGKMSNSNGSIDSSGQGHYWTSSPANGPHWKPTDPDYTSNSSSNLSRRVTLNAGQFSVGNLNRSAGMHVRCFKDDFKPEGTTGPLTIHLEPGQKTVIAVDADGKIQTLNDALDPSGSGFKGWYTTENFLNTTKVEKGDNLNGATDLYARWEGQEESFEVKIESSDTNSGTVSTGSIIVVSGTALGTLSGNPITIDGKDITATESTDTDQYDFSFVGWTNNCGATVTTGCTITANFKSEVKKYEIRWLNDNGSLIDTGLVEYGVVPTHAEPTKASTPEYDYTFAGWTPTIVSVTGSAEYQATFTPTKRKYEITWLNDDGSLIDTGLVEYGVVPTHADATKADTQQYSYTFIGWTPTLTGVTGHATYTAQFDETLKKYEIIWEDGDGKTLKTEQVEYGTTPNYTGTTPTKTATAQYTYTFNNTWSPVIESVTTGVTYTAQFDSTVNEYLITFVDGDGKTIQTGMVAYGDTPNYTGTTPTKTATAQYTYTFTGWSPAIGSVAGETTYIAEFSGTINQYKITFVDEDGTELLSGILYDYGTAIADIKKPADPTKSGNSQYTYVFDGWTPILTQVVGDQTYTAKYKSISINNGGGTILKKDKCPNGDYSDSYYDGICGENPKDSSAMPQNDNKYGSAGEGNGYTDEELSAYEWAYKYGITTIDNIQDADPDGYVIRGHMAKMVVNFMINVLGFEMPESISDECLTLNNGKIPRESEEIRNYAVQSCALGVMGIDMRENNFLANDILSRAEFGTIISRVLWGDIYNVKHAQDTPYYSKHLEALNKEGIMTQIDRPLTRKELRKRVWVMMKRMAEKE